MLVTLEDMTLRMAGEIASGMHYLHARPRPVIHRDIKSDNVLVTAAFEAKLADFGVPDVRGWWSGVAPLHRQVHARTPEQQVRYTALRGGPSGVDFR
jgi:serine/threonine protein kinase